MAVTLELVDEGGVVADFTGSTYTAFPGTLEGLGQTAFASRVRDRRDITFEIKVVGSTVADLEDKVRTLANALAVAAYRERTKQGTQTLLKMQFGNSGANDIEWQVLGGGVGVPRSSLDPRRVGQFRQWRVTVSFICEFLGHLSTTTITPETLENEVDGNANYMDITWTPTVVGRGPDEGLLRVQIARAGATAWNGSKKVWIATRSGERFDDVLFYQAPDSVTQDVNPVTTDNLTLTNGVTGGRTTNASGGASAFAKYDNTGGAKTQDSTDWTSVGYFQFDISTLPKGQFRVLARVNFNLAGTPNVTDDELGVGLGFVFGGVTKTPSSGGITAAASGDWRTFDGVTESEWNIRDLGILDIPPNQTPETTYTDPTLNLRIHIGMFLNGAAWNSPGDVTVDLDHIWLFPADEDSVVVNDVSDTDEIVIDPFGDVAAVYLVNDSDVVQKFADATGNYKWTIGPENNIRLMWLRDDTGDPTVINALMSPFTIGRTEGM